MTCQLDEYQLAAVEAPVGDILVVAPPGSGKTRVLVERARKLLRDGVAPSAIMCVTFTRKAAEEMKQRLKGQKGVDEMWIGTFHSLCYRMLKQEPEAVGALGYRPGWTIIDDDAQDRIMSKIIRERGRSVEARDILSAISIRKLTLEDPSNSPSEPVKELAPLYQTRLLEMNVMDFDDLLTNALEMFTRFPQVAAKYGSQFRHILVDEFQDTDPCQWEILKILQAQGAHLFCVGDIDQAIYSFRGASLDPVMEFKDSATTTVYELHRNYRSQARVVDLADSLIVHNLNRVDRPHEAVRPKGEPVELYIAATDEIEAIYVAGLVRELLREGIEPGEVAILMRTSFQFPLIDKALTRAGVPHEIIGHASLLGLAVVKDVMALLRLAVNPFDASAFERAVLAARCGIGEKTIEQVAPVLQKGGLDAVFGPDGPRLSAKTLVTLHELAQTVELIRSLGPGEAVEAAESWLRSHFKWAGGHRMEEFVELARDFEQEARVATLDEFVAFIATIGEESSKGRVDPKSCVKLMTMHAAKGKEFRYVFLPALEDGIVPHRRAADAAHLEEERRLFYVAITRAKDKLYLSWARQRVVAGVVRWSEPSRFLEELSGDIHVVNALSGVVA